MHHAHVLIMFARSALLFDGTLTFRLGGGLFCGLLHLGRRDTCSVQAVFLIPVIRIVFQLLQHMRHVLAQAVLWGPTQMLLGL